MNYKRPLYYKKPVIIGDDVKSVQERLKELNYYNGNIDGSFGPACDSAVKQFQLVNDLDVDGSVGPATWNILFSVNASKNIVYSRPLKYTTPIITGSDVEFIQKRLYILKFYLGEIDGSFGPACDSAVRAFQKANGLDVDGSIGPATWNALFKIGVTTSIPYTRPLSYKSPIMKGDDVLQVQTRLKELGFYNSNIDGCFGPACDSAVRAFQRSNGLDPDGSVGPATWNALFNSVATGNQQYKRAIFYTIPTMTGDDVVSVQRKLQLLGFYNGEIDGSFGPACDSAVRAFQTVNNLDVDGSVGPATWNTLFNTNPSQNIQYSRPLSYKSPIIKGDDVKHVQKRLKALGFYNGEIDGCFGPACDSAVRAFQKANGLSVDGSIGPATWNLLFNTGSTPNISYSRPLSYKSPIMKGEDVKHVQRRLRALGFYFGNIDGSFGPSCDAAVRAFQKANGLSVDGSVGPATWNALFGNDSIGDGGTADGSISNVKKVFIDAGHGGSDPGALGNGLQEKNVVLPIATLLGNKLKAKGIEVKYSRTNDTYVSLQERARQANNWGADLFLSIHANYYRSSAASGTECFTTSTTSQNTKNLSKSIASAISAKLGINNRGHKEESYYVLRETKMPAILIETAFVTNYNDAQLLKNRANDFAEAIASKIDTKTTTTPTNAEMLAFCSKNGLFKGMGIELSALNFDIVPPRIVNLDPLITMKCEADISPMLMESSSKINIGLGAEGLAAEFTTKLVSLGVDMNIPMGNLVKSLSKLTAANDIGNFIKYKYEIKPDSSVKIILESSLPFRRTPADDIITIYQRIIVTVYVKKKNGSSLISAPIESINSSYDINQKYTIVEAILLVSVLTGIIVLSPIKIDPQKLLIIIKKFLSASIAS